MLCDIMDMDTHVYNAICSVENEVIPHFNHKKRVKILLLLLLPIAYASAAVVSSLFWIHAIHWDLNTAIHIHIHLFITYKDIIQNVMII